MRACVRVILGMVKETETERQREKQRETETERIHRANYHLEIRLDMTVQSCRLPIPTAGQNPILNSTIKTLT